MTQLGDGLLASGNAGKQSGDRFVKFEGMAKRALSWVPALVFGLRLALSQLGSSGARRMASTNAQPPWLAGGGVIWWLIDESTDQGLSLSKPDATGLAFRLVEPAETRPHCSSSGQAQRPRSP
jgi:hypothetical protein